MQQKCENIYSGKFKLFILYKYTHYNEMRMLCNAFNVHWTEFHARKLNSLVTFNYGAILARVALIVHLIKQPRN
jgi:hypothetical protein